LQPVDIHTHKRELLLTDNRRRRTTPSYKREERTALSLTVFACIIQLLPGGGRLPLFFFFFFFSNIARHICMCGYTQPGSSSREGRRETASFSFATARILLSRGLIKKSAGIRNDFYVLSLSAPLFFASHHTLLEGRKEKRSKGKPLLVIAQLQSQPVASSSSRPLPLNETPSPCYVVVDPCIVHHGR
jgi:hypothetical protein